VQLTVEDNGKGIGASVESTPRTFGLIGMRERARMLGGELAVHSKPGAGTSIVMIVPRRTGAPEAPS
jgi:signal transduction histidine kinase